MAPVAPAADPSNLLQKLSLDPQPKSKDAVEATKQVSVAHTGSSNAESSNMWTPSEGSSAPVLSEFTDGGNYYVPTCYASPAYFFGGYDQAVKDWNDYSTYVNQDGMQGMNAPRPTPGMRPTAPLVSRMCGFGYGHSSMFMDGISHSEGQGNISFGNYHELSELNRGPRVVHSKNHKVAGPPPVISGKSQNLSSSGNENTGVSLDCEQYNREDFPDKYSDAKFFIIKSYSEDDIHKSIKYNVWASTPNGNKKLDAGYQKAHEKAGGCPVFLFFSVNTSGQFVGVAEMVGRVDFNKTVDYWQQDKWIGCFPVKWHIIKDVPNSNLKHITLESNENKPVTNSRDTQEVELEQGIQMLKIFKEHTSNTSLLDDFDFYEHRQHFMQVKRAKQQLQKQAWDGKTSHKPVEGNQVVGNEFNLQSDSVTNKEAVNSDHVQRTPVEIIATADAGDALKVTNGAASGVASGF
ncbi:YTH domain-containing protein ECT4-like isoform X2 [Zingiber officinale]|uniref:YTH domain-containing protein ECT4-like isoform X2 n=1 Tax=Zingiber officinale TaxID=94328 RepID=UPI001C4C3FDF|nr:YTH domain-containing protein ECT4-like isoform X2 [Zingiber officinale]